MMTKTLRTAPLMIMRMVFGHGNPDKHQRKAIVLKARAAATARPIAACKLYAKAAIHFEYSAIGYRDLGLGHFQDYSKEQQVLCARLAQA